MALSNKVLVPGIAALAVAIGIAGGSIMTASTANAATASDTATSPTSNSSGSGSTSSTPTDTPKGPHSANGVTEQELTGDTATKAKDAALAANPGATIDRVETDAEGAAYEAHITKSDGTRATVKLDSSFNVTSTEDGMR
jgi:uncharacterized membrane protein YkoI